MSNETKNDNNLGIKFPYNILTNINLKEKNKSQSGGKLLNSERKKQILKHSKLAYDIKTPLEYNK